MRFNRKKMLKSSFGYNLNYSYIKNDKRVNSNDDRIKYSRASSAKCLLSETKKYFAKISRNKIILNKNKILLKNKSISNSSYNYLLIILKNFFVFIFAYLYCF